MTIKHAIPKILSGRLNYYITRWRQEVREFGDQTRWWQDAVEEACTQQGGAKASGWTTSGEQERKTDGHKRVGQYVSVLFGLQLPLTHKPFK